MKKQLPNILTLGNLLCGCLACIIICKGTYPDLVLYLLIGSLLLDFLDGFVARAVNASGPLGAELDSLADMVSFGLSPALMLFTLLNGPNVIDKFLNQQTIVLIDLLSFFGLFIALFSAYRLAKFNIDTEQTYYFKGMNTPTCTMLIFSIYYMVYSGNYTVPMLINPFFLTIVAIICCVLLVSNIPMKALKFNGFSWNDNKLTYIIILISILGLLIAKIVAIPFLIIFYIILSLIFKKQVVGE